MRISNALRGSQKGIKNTTSAAEVGMMKAMRRIPHIAICSLAYAPFMGGAELAVKEITDRIKRTQFTCVTYRFNRDWLDEERIGNAQVLRVGKGKALRPAQGERGYYGRTREKLLYVFRAFRALEAMHRRDPIDALWAIMASYGGIAALLFKLRHPKIPLLLTLQEGDSESHILRRVGILYPFWRLLFRNADYIHAISSYLAEFARRHGATCPIEVVPNGVDAAKIAKRTLPITRRTPRKKREWILITTSRLVEKNGVDILIRAFAKVQKLLPETACKLHIVGGGPDEKKLKNLARSLGVADRAVFVGHVEPAWVSHYLREADIFVRPSRSEGLGSSFLEAMAAGLPVIGTRVGGIPDFLKDPHDAGVAGATGLFAEADNPASVAEKIALLIKNPEVRKKIGENGRKLVEKSYTWDGITGRMRQIFQSITHNS